MDGRRLFNDIARVASGAAGAFGGIRSRMEGELHEHVERLMARMNFVTREEYDVVAAMVRAARAEQEELRERVKALELKLGHVASTSLGSEMPAADVDQAPAPPRPRRGRRKS